MRDKLQRSLSHLNQAGAFISEVESTFDEALEDVQLTLTDSQKQTYEENKYQLDQILRGLAMLHDVIESYWRNF